MSMCCVVFSDKHLTTLGQWQAGIDALGFALQLDAAADEAIEEVQGHRRAVWDEIEAGGRRAGHRRDPMGGGRRGHLRSRARHRLARRVESETRRCIAAFEA